MKYLSLIIVCLFSLSSCSQQVKKQNVITYDIDNFWEAHDKIRSTTDSIQQYKYLAELFLDKGSPGLTAIMQARRYTPKSYVDAINNYPLFWNSIRENTRKANSFAKDIETGVNKLEKIYSDLRPAKIYFTVGAFRTPGTTMDSMLLIGSELAMADENTITNEFPNTLGHLKAYFATNPIKEIVFLNVHEYVHTQQRTAIGSSLLTQCLREGVAEFVAVKASGQASPTPAISYGKTNEAQLKEKFSKDLFSYSYRDWLWNDTDNEYKVRDLGYYMGYAIAEKYYEEAKDKEKVIKEIIELDYQSSEAVENFVDKVGYFSTSIQDLKRESENRRPEVINITQFKNGAQNVDPNLTQITFEFSKPMDQYTGGFEYGPLGEDHVLRVKSYVGFSEDGKSVTVEVALKPNRHYQSVVSERFLSEDGMALKPYLIDIQTARE